MTGFSVWVHRNVIILYIIFLIRIEILVEGLATELN